MTKLIAVKRFHVKPTKAIPHTERKPSPPPTPDTTMDRHDCVEKLIAKRDALLAESSSLNRQITAAAERTRDAILNWSGSAEYLAAGTIINTGDCWILGRDQMLPEKDRVSDDDIHALHVEIGKLESSIPELHKKLEELKKKDFVAYLAKLISQKA